MDNIELRQIAIAGSIIFLTLVGVIYTGTNPKAKVPPGPRGLSILGNALQVPSQVRYSLGCITYKISQWIL